jgi:hypothetical protein
MTEKWIEGLQEWGVDEDTCAKKEKQQDSTENCIIRTFVICGPHEMLFL